MSKKQENKVNMVDFKFKINTDELFKETFKNINQLSDMIKVGLISNNDIQNTTVKKLSEDLNATWNEHYIYTTEKIKNINIDDIDVLCEDEQSLKLQLDKINSISNVLTELNILIEQDFDGAEIAKIDNDLVFKLQRNKSTIDNYIALLNSVKVKINMHQIELKMKEFNKKIDEANRDSNQMKKKYTKVISNISRTSKKLDGILTNVFALLITFSFVAALVTAIDNINEKFIPLLLMSGIWMSVTLIVFISGIYKIDYHDEDNHYIKNKHSWFPTYDTVNTRQSIVLYLVISIAEIVVLICTLLYM